MCKTAWREPGFPHRHIGTVDRGDGKAKSRFPEPPRRALEQFRPGGDGATETRVGGGTERVVKSDLCGFRQHACRIQGRVLHVIETVKHNSLTSLTRSNAEPQLVHLLPVCNLAPFWKLGVGPSASVAELYPGKSSQRCEVAHIW